MIPRAALDGVAENSFEQIEARLRKLPGIAVESSESTLCVRPAAPGSFEVGLEPGPEGWVVWLEGWHEEFESEGEALECFLWALSPACRLRVEFRGSTPVAWQVESEIDGSWVTAGRVGLIFRPFWRPHRVEYFQNQVWALV